MMLSTRPAEDASLLLPTGGVRQDLLSLCDKAPAATSSFPFSSLSYNLSAPLVAVTRHVNPCSWAGIIWDQTSDHQMLVAAINCSHRFASE